MTTTQTTETTVRPEIPRPLWATERYLEDEGRVLIDEHTFSEGIFDVELQVAHRLDSDDVYTGDAHAFVRWVSTWTDGASESEYFAIRAQELDGLLLALGKARDALAP